MTRGMSADDLMNVVDFIKNEEKYAAKIKELKAAEAKLSEKIKIANTVEKAEALMAKATKTLSDVEQIKEDELKKLEEVKVRVSKEQDVRKDELNAKELSLRSIHDKAMDALSKLESERSYLKGWQEELEVQAVRLDRQEKALKEEQEKLQVKLNKLAEVLNG